MALKTVHAGHGGADPGAVGNGYKESEVCQTITQKMCKISGAYDASDKTSTSVSQNLGNIVRNVNSANPSPTDWHISNHLNAASPSATGVEVWYYAGDSTAKQKAEEVSATIANALKIPNRGAKPTSDFYVVMNTTGRMLLIEWCFITNASDMQRLMNNMDSAVSAVMKLFGYGSTSQTVVNVNNPILGNLEAVNINNVALSVQGWLVDNTKPINGTPFVFFMDESGTKELTRFKADKKNRPDVLKVHPKANIDCGIVLNTTTPNFLKGQRARVLFRIASDSKGDKTIIEQLFTNVFQIPARINTGQLDFKIPVVNEFYLAGWHLNDEVYKGVYSYVIFIEATTQKEIARVDITKSSFLSSSDVRKQYPAYLSADACRFEVKAQIPDAVKGKKVEILQRYAKNSNGEGAIADLKYKDLVQF